MCLSALLGLLVVWRQGKHLLNKSRRDFPEAEKDWGSTWKNRSAGGQGVEKFPKFTRAEL